MKKIIFILSFGFQILGFAVAQQSIHASGGDANGTGGSASFSIGQVAYTASSSGTGSVSQGVQHAYAVNPLGLNKTEGKIVFSVFPNPAQDVLSLQLNDDQVDGYTFEFVNALGQLLKRGQIAAQNTIIPMTHLPAASYYVYLLNSNKETVQSFQIIKN